MTALTAPRGSQCKAPICRFHATDLLSRPASRGSLAMPLPAPTPDVPSPALRPHNGMGGGGRAGGDGDEERPEQRQRLMVGGRPADAVRMRAATAGMVRRLQAAAVARRGAGGLGARLMAKREGEVGGGARGGGAGEGGGLM